MTDKVAEEKRADEARAAAAQTPAHTTGAAKPAGAEEPKAKSKQKRPATMTVAARTASRRRSGFIFTPTPQVISTAELTDDQYTALVEDPQLVFVEGGELPKTPKAKSEGNEGLTAGGVHRNLDRAPLMGEDEVATPEQLKGAAEGKMVSKARSGPGTVQTRPASVPAYPTESDEEALKARVKADKAK